MPTDPTYRNDLIASYSANWRRVGKEEFFAAIGPRNCHPHPTGPHPYVSEFTTPERRVIGFATDDAYYLPH